MFQSITSIREESEAREKAYLAPDGCQSSASRGRMEAEDPLCPIRTVFQQDRDRIMYANSFRRLKHKTQVFLSPLGDHYRTRLTHTLEVSAIARVICRALRLNEDLAEAIALGHDIGHTPFGHSGETVLKEIFNASFSHNEQSLRVVDKLEHHGKGLNLTYEVRDGILKHSKGFGKIIPDDPADAPFTLEGQVVRVADIIAYLNHDLDDAIRAGVISRDQIPAGCTRVLGDSHAQRTNTMIRDLIDTSCVAGGRLQLAFSEALLDAMTQMRQFLFHNVYRSETVHREFVKSKKILADLFGYFMTTDDALTSELAKMEMGALLGGGETRERVVCDLIASLTDRHALRLFNEIFMPSPMR